MRSLEMRKKRRLRWVCAPQRWSAGTSIGPKLSFSVRVPAIPARMLRQVEQQDFGGLTARKLEAALIGLQRIACRKPLAIHGDRAARHVHVRLATFAQLGARALGAVKQAGVHARVLMDTHRTVGALWRSDEAQAAALLAGGEMLLLVLGRDAAHLRLDPDLQEMRRAALVVVELAVRHAATGAHALHVARHDGRAGAHRVLVGERALEHVADDFHVAMAVGAEAGTGLHAVLVDDAQRPEAHVPRIVVGGEGKAVKRAQPAVIGIAALGGAAQLLHVYSELAAWLGCCCDATSACTLAMSRAFACAITCSSAAPGSAPACWNRITFSPNTISVGIERRPHVPPSPCRPSVIPLPKTTSGCVSAACS